MTLGLIKFHPARAGRMAWGVATSAATLLARGVDLVKRAPIAEMCRLRLGPSPELRIVNADEIDLWEILEQRLVGHALRIARPVVMPCGNRLALRTVKIF